MTYQFEQYDPLKLADAVRLKGTYSFTLGTSEPQDLGVFALDDQKQICEGGRFSLAPWHALGRRLMPGLPLNGLEILQDASQHAPYLFLQLDPGAGPKGMGEISATYNALDNQEAPTLRTVTVQPVK